MPIYHFNVGDGCSAPDDLGTELIDIASARVEAVKLAGAILLEGSPSVWDTFGWRLVVTDDECSPLLAIQFQGFRAIH